MTWLRDNNTHINKPLADNSKSVQKRVVMCEFIPMMSNVSSNGGWTKVGDGEGNKKLIITQGDISIALEEDDIVKLIESLAFFDPRFY